MSTRPWSRHELMSWTGDVQRLHRQIEEIENAVFVAEGHGDAHALTDLRALLSAASRQLEDAKSELLHAHPAVAARDQRQAGEEMVTMWWRKWRALVQPGDAIIVGLWLGAVSVALTLSRVGIRVADLPMRPAGGIATTCCRPRPSPYIHKLCAEKASRNSAKSCAKPIVGVWAPPVRYSYSPGAFLHGVQGILRR